MSYVGRKEVIERKKYRQFVFEGVSLGRREEFTTGGTKRDREGVGGLRGNLTSGYSGGAELVEKTLAEEARVNQKRAQVKKKRIEIEEFVGSVGRAFGVMGGEVMGGKSETSSHAGAIGGLLPGFKESHNEGEGVIPGT